MISSCTKHSRSAQRRPWRSFSSTACAVARAAEHLGLEQLRDRGAKLVFAAGMLFGQRIDRRRYPHGVETFVRLGAGLCDSAIHGLTRLKDAARAVTAHSLKPAHARRFRRLTY